MACAICNKTGATYRLVDGDTVAVCEQCVAEHLTADLETPTCLYCDDPGEYDLAVLEGAVTGPDSRDDYEVVAEDVVCESHLAELRGESE